VRVRLFSANDYLGLSSHAAVRAAACRAASACGNGPRASALVAGYTHEHAALERQLARLKGTQDALLFPSGFAANASVVAARAHSTHMRTHVTFLRCA
jgi:8-amino-7-oxononanoate synthase